MNTFVKTDHVRFAARSSKFIALMFAVLFALPAAFAADVTKHSSGTDLTSAASWSGGTGPAPTATDVAVWDTGSLGAGLTLNSGTPSWQGIKVNAGAADPISIGSGGTLTLGVSGINLSSATINLTNIAGLILGAGSQTWTVATGRTFTESGTLTRSAGASLLVDKSSFTGTVTASPTLVNSVAPWAHVKSSGAAAAGTAAGYNFATVTGGNVVPYTGATAATTGTSAWGGIPSGGTGTINYDVSMTSPGVTGLNRNVNTLRYIGGAATQNGNTASTLLNANCILNAGTGTFTIGGGGTAGLGVAPSSSANELVLAAANANITIGASALIANNGANPAAVTVVGPNIVTLAGPSTFTGDVNVNGTLVANLSRNSLNPTTSALGNPQVARNLNVNNGGTLQFLAGDTLGGANSAVVSTLVINRGGVVTNNNNNFNTFGPIQLNGGTLTGGGGAAAGYQMYNLRGTVTVGGSSMSTISGSGTLPGFHLAAPTTFNVADVAAGTDLNVSGVLIDRNATDGGSGSLVKSGAGTMMLTAVNTYTGSTTVSNGTLALSGSGSLASSNILVVSPGKFDVSAITYTLAAGRTLGGSGVVTGNVATAGTSAITPGGLTVGDVGVLTFTNNLNLSAGGTATFDLSTTASGSGNDQIAVGGNLTLSSSSAIHINALSGSLEAADYVLCAVSGTTTAATMPTLFWDGAVPGNNLNYSLLKVGNNLVLHYSTTIAPSVASASVTPNPAYRNQAVIISANVTKGSSNIVSVTVDLTSIGGSATSALVLDGASSSNPNYVYTNTFVVAASTALGDKSLTVVATDDTSPTPATGSYIITPLTISANAVTWDGGGSDDKWSSNTNWSTDLAPGLAGDSVTFTGATRLTPDLDANYSVTSVTFDGGADAFTIGSSTASTLTNSGGIVNNSTFSQTLNVPVVLSAAQTFNASSGNLTVNSNLTLGANLLTLDGGMTNTLAGVVSGTTGLTVNGGGTLVLSGANTQTGTATVNSGTIISANPNALGTAARVNVPGNSTATLAVRTDGGDAPIKLGMSSGSTVINLVSDRATAGAGISHPLSVLAGAGLGGGTLNFTAGANVTSGTANFNFDNFGLGAGSAQITTLNPTTATVTITNASKFNNGVAQTLQLDGTSSGNEIIGTIANGAATITVTKANSSTWKLSGTNTFTGGVNLNGGTLIANNATALGASGTISFGGGTLQYGPGIATDISARISTAASQACSIDVNGNSVTYAAALTSSGGTLTLADTAGGGSLTLGGANTYTGNTTINAGKLLSATTGSAASAFTVASGATNGVLLASANGAWTNSSSVTQNAGSKLEINFQNFAPSTNVAPMKVDTLNVSPTVTLVVKGVAANFTVGQTNPLIAWTTSGPADASAFALVMPSRLTGHLLVSGNTLNLVVDAFTGPISWNTGNGTWNTSTPNWVDALLAPATFIDGGDAVVFGNASGATGNPVVTLNSALAPTSVTVNSASHNYTLSGTGGIIGSGSLAVQNGTLTLATTNAYTGGTTVSGGTLQISGDGTMGASTGALTVLGGTVDLGTTSRTKGAVTIAGGTITNGTLSGTSFAATNAGAVTLSAVLSGTGALTKTGNGTLTLSGTNNYTGGTTVANGSLALTGNGTLGATNNALTISGGTLDLGALTTPTAGAVTFSGGTVSNGTLTAYTSYTANSTGGTLVSANLTGAVALTKTGAGTLTLSGVNNTYSGGTIIGSGQTPAVIRAAANNALGTGGIQFDAAGNSTTARLELTGGITLTNAISLTGRTTNSAAIENISGNNFLPGVISLNVGGSIYQIQSDAGSQLTLGTASATAISAVSGSRVVTLQGAGNGNVVGAINDGGGAVALVKADAGTWTLSSPNFYSGTTTVSGGTLLVNGSTSTGAVAVNGGTLGGTGTIAGAVTLNSGGTLSPGASTGTLTINGSLTMNAGSTNTFEVNGTTLAKDLVAAGGSVAYGGTLNIVPSGTFSAGQTFQLFSGTGATNASNFASIAGSPGGSLAFAFTNGVLSVVSSAPTPEPIITSFDASSGKLVLSWSQPGWTLESQTNSLATGLSPTGWTPVTGATSPFTNTVNPANGSVFYRLKN